MLEMVTSFACMIMGCAALPAIINHDVFYRIYQGSIEEYVDVSSGDIKKLNDSVDPSLPTIMYVHGWRESCDNNSATTIITALHCHHGYNFICLDWSVLADANYLSAAPSTSTVGNIISKDLNFLCNQGFETSTMHIIGFSLGAHVAGVVGNTLKSTDCKCLGKITALDAGKPLFHPRLCMGCRPMEPTDAEMTYACHSDGGAYGVASPTAIFDFYLNNGTRTQKGCPPAPAYLSLSNIKPIYRCSHDRCWKAFAEAICDRTSQVARKCDSYESFTSGSCSKNPTVPIGLKMPTNISGTWYYRTTRESPFGKGDEGAYP